MKEKFIKRLKSLLWRLSMMLLAFIVDFAIENLTEFGLAPEVTVLIGLVLGEISKWLNSK